MSETDTGRRAGLLALLAGLLAVAGLLAYRSGVEARVAAEPPGLVAGAGLLPGVDGDQDAEIRTPGGVSLPSPALRRAGSGARRFGAALMAAALALAAAAQAGGGVASRLVRWLWVGLAALGLWSLVARGGAGAASAGSAAEGFRAGALIYGLGMLLALSWGRRAGAGTSG